jgi:hypothetical protein
MSKGWAFWDKVRVAKQLPIIIGHLKFSKALRKANLKDVFFCKILFVV